jgi:hypothetical protein
MRTRFSGLTSTGHPSTGLRKRWPRDTLATHYDSLHQRGLLGRHPFKLRAPIPAHAQDHSHPIEKIDDVQGRMLRVPRLEHDIYSDAAVAGSSCLFLSGHESEAKRRVREERTIP